MSVSRSQSSSLLVRASSVAPDSERIIPEKSYYLDTISLCWPRYRNFLNEYSYRSHSYGPYYYDRFYKKQHIYTNPHRAQHYDFLYYP